MRNWPIRRKLFAAPMVGALLTLTTLWLEPSAPMALTASVSAAILTLLAGAWLQANAVAKRLRTLRDSMSYLVDRDTAPAAGAARGDELELLLQLAQKAASRRRERQGRLRRSSEFLEFAQAAGGFGVFDLDLVTGQVTGTPLFFELAGLENPNSLLTREEWLATVHPEDLEAVLQQLNSAIASNGKFLAEYRSLLLDGGTRWLASRGQVLPDTHDFPARAIGTVTDITERKSLEAKLRSTTDSLNHALAAAGVATLDSGTHTSAEAKLARFIERAERDRKPRREIDFDALQAITGGDAEFERVLVETFVSSGDQCLAEIVAALHISDLETVGRRAHTLKGASASIHANTLSAAASKLENAARSRSIDEIDGLVREVREEFRAVHTQLARF